MNEIVSENGADVNGAVFGASGARNHGPNSGGVGALRVGTKKCLCPLDRARPLTTLDQRFDG